MQKPKENTASRAGIKESLSRKANNCKKLLKIRKKERQEAGEEKQHSKPGNIIDSHSNIQEEKGVLLHIEAADSQ